MEKHEISDRRLRIIFAVLDWFKSHNDPISFKTENPAADHRGVKDMLNYRGRSDIHISRDSSAGVLWFWRKK